MISIKDRITLPDTRIVFKVSPQYLDKLVGLLWYLQITGYRLVQRLPIIGLGDRDVLVSHDHLPSVERFFAIYSRQNPPRHPYREVEIRDVSDVRTWLNCPDIVDLDHQGWQQGIYPREFFMLDYISEVDARKEVLLAKISDLSFNVSGVLVSRLRKLVHNLRSS